jgi:hypothetical protein
VVAHRLWQQLQSSDIALSALHRALLDGRYEAWLNGEWRPTEYWQAASLRIGWYETSPCVDVVIDGAAVPGPFHVCKRREHPPVEIAPAEAVPAATAGPLPVPPANKGGRPEKWDWLGLPAILKEREAKGHPIPFESEEALEEWCLNNVRRTDRKPHTELPDVRTVKAAIKRHQLDLLLGYSGEHGE